MDLAEKKSELIRLISQYLENQVSLDCLQKFSWEMIEYFSKIKKAELPPYQTFEKEFWYTIWQMQHLADEQHEKEGLTRQVLLDALDYLNGSKKIPRDYVGERP